MMKCPCGPTSEAAAPTSPRCRNVEKFLITEKKNPIKIKL